MAKMFPPPILLYVMLSYDNKIIIQGTPKTMYFRHLMNETNIYQSEMLLCQSSLIIYLNYNKKRNS